MNVILFKTEQCEICKQVDAKLKKILTSESFKGKEVTVVTLSDKSKRQYGISVVPTIISFSGNKKSKKEIKRIVGVDVLPNLEKFLVEYV